MCYYSLYLLALLYPLALPVLTVPAWPPWGSPHTAHSPGPQLSPLGLSIPSPMMPQQGPSPAPHSPALPIHDPCQARPHHNLHHPLRGAWCPGLRLPMVPHIPDWGGETSLGCQALSGIVLDSHPMGTAGPCWALAWNKNCRKRDEKEASGELWTSYSLLLAEPCQILSSHSHCICLMLPCPLPVRVSIKKLISKSKQQQKRKKKIPAENYNRRENAFVKLLCFFLISKFGVMLKFSHPLAYF